MAADGTFNWIGALAMLGFAIFVGLAGRITLRGGEIIDRDGQPARFWVCVIGCGIVGLALLAQAACRFR
jgi:hypothetical protein